MVPVCLSCTHVAWGAIRLEPTWMNIGESAGVAAAMAVKNNTTLPAINREKLLISLAEKRIMISFFNNFDIHGQESYIPALQYFGTKGFFRDYNARENEPLDKSTLDVWLQGLQQIKDKMLKANHLAKSLPTQPGPPVSATDLERMLKEKGISHAAVATEKFINPQKVTRGEACALLSRL